MDSIRWHMSATSQKASPESSFQRQGGPSYRKLLYRARPRAIFTMNLDEALAQAAHELDIPVIEVLHGKCYHTIPWGWSLRSANKLPNYVLAFDKDSAKTFSGLDSRSVKTLRSRDPWIEKFLRTPDSVPSDWVAPASLKGNAEKVVVVSLQWGWSRRDCVIDEHRGVLPDGLLPTAALEAIKETEGKVRWLIRLHPVQLRRLGYRWVRKNVRDLQRRHPNTEWELSSTLPLPSLLSIASHHVTMSSGSSFEAALMGVPTAAMSPTLREGQVHEKYQLSLREAGYLSVLDPNDGRGLIDWLARTGPREAFESDGVETPNEVIDELLREL